jgi:hypothetical protein
MKNMENDETWGLMSGILKQGPGSYSQRVNPFPIVTDLEIPTFILKV